MVKSLHLERNEYPLTHAVTTFLYSIASIAVTIMSESECVVGDVASCFEKHSLCFLSLAQLRPFRDKSRFSLITRMARKVFDVFFFMCSFCTLVRKHPCYKVKIILWTTLISLSLCFFKPTLECIWLRKIHTKWYWSTILSHASKNIFTVSLSAWFLLRELWSSALIGFSESFARLNTFITPFYFFMKLSRQIIESESSLWGTRVATNTSIWFFSTILAKLAALTFKSWE